MNLPDFLEQDDHGFIHLTGHRVGLRHVVDRYIDGANAEWLHEHFPTLPLSLVHKVIAFYLENRPAVDDYIQRSREALERQASAPRAGPSAAELQRRMQAGRPKESA